MGLENHTVRYSVFVPQEGVIICEAEEQTVEGLLGWCNSANVELLPTDIAKLNKAVPGDFVELHDDPVTIFVQASKRINLGSISTYDAMTWLLGGKDAGRGTRMHNIVAEAVKRHYHFDDAELADTLDRHEAGRRPAWPGDIESKD